MQEECYQAGFASDEGNQGLPKTGKFDKMRIPIGTLHHRPRPWPASPLAQRTASAHVPMIQHDAWASHHALLGHTLAHNISDSRQRTQSAPPAHKTPNGILRYPRLAPGAVYPC